MTKTTVVNRHHKVPYDIYIGRGSKWGNPFSHMDETTALYKTETREEAVEKYREWIQTQPQLLESLHELKGKVLACYCHPSACHGHVLAELADSLPDIEYGCIRIIIAGGRDFNDYEYLQDKVSDFIIMQLPPELWNPDKIEIVSGCAKGADSLGERYAKERGCKIARFPADWNGQGKKAGIVRNHEMGDYADILLAFHDGESTGTLDMINYATKKGLLVDVFTYEPIEWSYFSEEQGNGFNVSFTAFYKQQIKKHSREPVGKKIKIDYQEYERGGKT